MQEKKRVLSHTKEGGDFRIGDGVVVLKEGWAMGLQHITIVSTIWPPDIIWNTKNKETIKVGVRTPSFQKKINI